MPGYAGQGQAVLLRQGQQAFLFQREGNLVGRASVAYQVERIPYTFQSAATCVSFQTYFTDANGNPADPGVFEVDIQTSDIDQDGQYSTVNTFTGALNANFSGRVELINFFAKYIRVFVKTMTNAVFLTAQVTH